jgi:hypothetical protein
MEHVPPVHHPKLVTATVVPVATECKAPPKWAAIVADRLIPLPRRVMHARDILFQANAAGRKLVRDLDSPVDVAFDDDDEVDLAEGNVFRLETNCQCHHAPPFSAAAKFAFVVNDRWEVTINPTQTTSSMRGLFDLPANVDLLRDFESPHDELIGDCEEIRFPDGPVFRTERRDVTVSVNNKPVKFDHRRETGLGVKETAIKQKVNIQPNFVLYRVLEDDSLSPAITDEQRLILHDCEAFRCVAPDDNS